MTFLVAGLIEINQFAPTWHYMNGTKSKSQTDLEKNGARRIVAF